MRMLKRLWLLIGKLWALTVIFAGGGLLAITLIPLFGLCLGRKPEHAQNLIRASFRFYLGMLHHCRWVSVDISHAEKFAGCEGKMLIANHPSLLDVVILMAYIPRAQCIVKHELWNHPLLGILMRRAGFIRNDLDPEDFIEACRASLHQGRCLIIFPEGTRTPPGQNPHFQRGFANVATLTNASIQCVAITCTPPFLYKGEPWWHVSSPNPIFRVSFGKCLDAQDYSLYGRRSIDARKLVESLELYYADLVGHSDARARA